MYYLVKYKNGMCGPDDYVIVKTAHHKSTLLRWLQHRFPNFDNYNDPRREEQNYSVMNKNLYRIKYGKEVVE